MSYRYNSIDIIVGVGMCAILFGGLLLFLAANGTYQAIPPQTIAFEQQTGIDNGMGDTPADPGSSHRRSSALRAPCQSSRGSIRL